MRYMIENNIVRDGLRFRVAAWRPKHHSIDGEPLVAIHVQLLTPDAREQSVPGKMRFQQGPVMRKAEAQRIIDRFVDELTAEIGDADFVAIRVRYAEIKEEVTD